MRKALVITLACTLSYSGISQKKYVISDLESWSSLSIEKELVDDLSISLEQQLRLEKNSSLIQQYFTEFGIKYKFNKHIYTGFGYRYIRATDDEIYEPFRRFQFDLGYKHDIGRFDMHYRIRYQNKKQFPGEEQVEYAPEHGLRLKIESEYKIKDWKWDPEVGFEVFRYTEEQESRIGKIRFNIGTKYDFTKWLEFKPFYRIEYQFDQPYEKTIYIVGANLNFTF